MLQRWLFILLFLGLWLRTDATEEKRPRVALVLGGGAAKGFAHIGVLKVLEEENIPIDIVVGTSIGSIVGSLVALGYSADDIKQLAVEQDWERLFSDKAYRHHVDMLEREDRERYILDFSKSDKSDGLGIPEGFVRGQNVLNLFSKIYANYPDSIDFSNLEIPFACVATNLETGAEEQFFGGHLKEAVFASMCIPGVFKPCEYQGKLLVDGGVLNNFPTDVARSMGADIIIGVDLRKDYRKKEELTSFSSIIFQLFDIVEEKKNIRSKALCDVLISPNLDGYSSRDFSQSALDTLFYRGKEAAREQLDSLRSILKRVGVKRQDIIKDDALDRLWKIRSVCVPQAFSRQETFILNHLDIELNESYTHDELGECIDRLFGYSDFEKVDYVLEPEDDSCSSYQLKLNIEDASHAKYYAGFSLNTVDAATVYLGYGYKNIEDVFSVFRADAKVSVNPELRLMLESHNMRGFPVLGLMVKGGYSYWSALREGRRIGRVELYSTEGQLYMYKQLGNMFELGASAGVNYYYNRISPLSDINSLLDFTNGDGDFLFKGKLYLNLDNLDNRYRPQKGVNIQSAVTAYFPPNELEEPFFTASFKYKGVERISKWLDFLFYLNFRGVFGDDNVPLFLKNYAANEYRAFSDEYLPILGHRSVSLYDDFVYHTMGEWRFNLNEKHSISLMGDVSLYDDKWRAYDGGEIDYGVGVKYQRNTRIGPASLSLSVNSYMRGVAISGGLGFLF